MPRGPLSVGAYGDEVARVHRSLAAHGGPAPGAEVERRFFGPGTRRALLRFQRARGLPATGSCDAGTEAALTAPTVSQGPDSKTETVSAGTPTRRGAGNPGLTMSGSIAPHHGGSTFRRSYNETFNKIVAAMELPPPPSSVANYLPYRIVGNQLLLSGQAPFFGNDLKYTGKVGDSVSIDDATAAARLTGLNLLYVAQKALGSLNRIRCVIEVDGLVNCTPDFTQPSTVIDGCSDLMVEVFGPEYGKHVRSAVGQVSLAFDITTEISVTFEIDPPDRFGPEGVDELGNGSSDSQAAPPSRGTSSVPSRHPTAVAPDRPSAADPISRVGGAGHPGPPVTTVATAGPSPAAVPGFDRSSGGSTVAEQLLDYLELEGVTKVFGVPGGAVVYLLDQLRKRERQFEFVVCRHETGAAYMAHGYAVTTGDLGVVLTTTGPGATNGLTGAMNAQAANCSLLVVTGEVPQEYFGEGYLQEGADARLDVGVIYRNAVEYSAVVSSAKNFHTLFEQALRVARSQPARAAHVSLPNDIAGSCLPGTAENDGGVHPFPRSPAAYRAVPTGTDLDQVRATVHELADANRPLIFVGNGARQALAEPRRLERFIRFAERYAIPVMTTPDAKGIFPESHALSLRSYGMCACSWPEQYMGTRGAADHCDALLVLGSSLGELSTSVVAGDKYSSGLIPSGPFTQVDLDQSVIGRTFPVTRGIVADVGATIDALCDLGHDRRPDPSRVSDRWSLISDLKATTSPFADPEGRASHAHPLHPASMIRVINDLVEDGHIFVDAGNCVGWSLNNLVVDPPVRFHSALAMGPMGFGVGAVVGGKIGAPDKTCVCITGDGAFLMHGAEVSTAAQRGVGAIWVVLADNDLAMVSQGMGELFPREWSWDGYYDLGSPDLVTFAQGLGAQAYRVTRSEGPDAFERALTTAMRESRSHRPQVVVAHINTTVMPPYGWPALQASDCH